MHVDFVGIDALVQFIESSKKVKFSVYRAGSNQGLPLFDCLDTSSNEDAVSEFKKIAGVLNKGVAYKIILFNEADITMDEATGMTKLRKKSSRAGKMEALFALSNSLGGFNDSEGGKTSSPSLNIDDLRKQITAEVLQAQREDVLMAELKALRAKVEELEGIEEEDDDQEAEIGTDLMAKLMPLISMLQASGSKATINGVADDAKAAKIENINKAIKILAKYDDQIDTDLLKLASMAENNNGQFNMLLGMLRQM